MRKIETLFVGIALIAIVVVMGGAFWYHNYSDNTQKIEYPETEYGTFLAAQHAIYVNDFDTAAKLSAKLKDVDYPIVQSTKVLSDFLSGNLPENADLLKDEKATASRLIYDAYLVKQENWDELYKRHKKDESALASPLRIWASVATDHKKDALKFIDKLSTNESWKDFIRGQIYAETGEIEKAAESFAKVRTDFMNINDYLYIMSFYNHNEIVDAAEKLKQDFTAKPGGMFMLDFENIPDWSLYSGYQNALAFSLIQTVSHTQIMMYSDLAILLLRFAQITGPGINENNDAINYYLGQFFFNNHGDYKKHFEKIDSNSPFYLFSVLRMAEKSGNMKTLERAIKNNPLFVPAVNELIAYNIKQGNRRAALRVVNRALNDEKLTELGHAFFLKSRAHIYFTFGNLDAAQTDLHDASAFLPLDAEILSLQAKIWAAQNREIENAYDYAMMLVKQDPTDIMAWDTLGYVVAKREGVEAALDVLSRVGEVSVTCSSLFEHLGDLYIQINEKQLAKEAYLRAIELSDDGLTIVPVLEKKLRKIK